MIERFLDGIRDKLEDPDDVEYMAVLLPEHLDPLVRHYRYSMILDAELRLADLGCALGGGHLLGDEDEDGESEIAYSVLDVDAVDIDGVRALLRNHLPELGCLRGTLIQYGEELEDRYDGEAWHLGEPRSIQEA
jgi:hypothetical protein